jgi:hypothetical protein
MEPDGIGVMEIDATANETARTLNNMADLVMDRSILGQGRHGKITALVREWFPIVTGASEIP